jgi:transcriptional regulator with XRE-family HTH domain
MAVRRKRNARATGPIDKKIGAQIRAARAEAGLSQQALAKLTGITFQQIQKYETGRNRVSVARLVSLTATLEKPPSFFVEAWR